MLGAEGPDVGVRRARQRGERLDAAADQPSGDVDGPATEDRPAPLAGLLPRGRLRVLLEAPPVGDDARGALGHRAGGGGEVEPVDQPRGCGVRRVGEVVAVQGGEAGAQRQRQHPRGGVGVADDPGRLGRGDRVVVEEVDQVDRGDPAPRRHHRPDPRVDQHRGQLGRAAGSPRTDVGRAVHALPHDDLEATAPQPGDREVDPDRGGTRGARRGRGDADGVAGLERAREAEVHDAIEPCEARWPPPGSRSVPAVASWPTDQQTRESSSRTAARPASTSANEVDSGERPIRSPPGSR